MNCAICDTAINPGDGWASVTMTLHGIEELNGETESELCRWCVEWTRRLRGKSEPATVPIEADATADD